MDFMLQAHGEKFVYSVPNGLHELMSDIAREVLREQPSCLYAFIVAYLETLIRVRETTKYAIYAVDRALDSSQNLLRYVKSLGLSWEEANMAATIIQAAYRSYRTRVYLKQLRESQLREERLQEVMNNLISYFHERGITIEIAEEAATKIQALYRGYTVRKRGIQAMLQRKETVDRLGPLLYICKSEMLRAEAKQQQEFKYIYQQASQTTVSTTLSKLALEASVKKQHTHGFVYQQPSSPISISSSLFPGCKMPREYDTELSEVPLKVLTPSGNLMKLDAGSEDVSIHSCGSAELRDMWLQTLEFPTVPLISYEEVTQDRKLDDSYLKSVKSTASSKEQIPGENGAALSTEIKVEEKSSLKDEDVTSKKSTRSAHSVKSGQSKKTAEEKPSKTSSEKRTLSQKSVTAVASKDVVTKTQSMSSQTKSEQKIIENQKFSASVKSITSQNTIEQSAEKKYSQLIGGEAKLVTVSPKTSGTVEKKSSNSNASNKQKEQAGRMREAESDKLQTDMGPDIAVETVAEQDGAQATSK